jgi:hypothetical protein
MAFYQLLALRQSMSVATFGKLFGEWLRSFPSTHHAYGNLVGSGGIVFGGSAHATRRFGRSLPIEDQVSRIWDLIEEHEDRIGTLQTDVVKNKESAEKSITQARADFEGKLTKVHQELVEAVTSGPFIAVYGLFLIGLGLSIQIGISLPK